MEADVLATRVAMHVESLVPQGRARCLEVAHGEDTLAGAVRARTDRAEWRCVDLLEGDRLPYADGEFDVVLLCDVLRDGREGAARLLTEVGRVAQSVLVKDRFEEGASLSREAFVRLAADQRLRITALDADFANPSKVLPSDGDFIAVLRSA